MCRNIKKLRRPEGPPTDQELRDAALQFVRKISGYRTPSEANRDVFDAAVGEIAAVSAELLRELAERHPQARKRAAEPAAAS